MVLVREDEIGRPARDGRGHDRQRIGLEHIVGVDRDDPLAGGCLETHAKPVLNATTGLSFDHPHAWLPSQIIEQRLHACADGPVPEHDPFEALMSLCEHGPDRGVERLDRRTSVDAGHHGERHVAGSRGLGNVARQPIGFEFLFVGKRRFRLPGHGRIQYLAPSNETAGRA